MGKVWWICILWLVVSVQLRAQSVEEIIKRIGPHDSELTHIIDSFHKEYHGAPNTSEKFDNLLAVWSFFHARSENGFKMGNDVVITGEEMETVKKQLSVALNSMVKTGISSSQMIDYQLTQVMHPFHNTSLCNDDFFSSLDTHQMNPIQQSIYLLKQNICAFALEARGNRHLQSLYEARKPLGDSDAELALRARIDRRLTNVLYKQNSLDSALAEYQNTQTIIDKVGKKYQYVPGFGILGLSGLKSANLMNQGLILSRMGSMLAAANCFEASISVFEERKNIPGMFWGQQRLMSALFSVGDSEGAWKEFDAILKRAVEMEHRINESQCHTLVGVLSNTDYVEKKSKALWLDSILVEAWKRREIMEDPKSSYYVWERQAFREIDFLHTRALLYQMIGKNETATNFLKRAESVYAELTGKQVEDQKRKDGLIRRSSPVVLAWRAASASQAGNEAKSMDDWGKALTALDKLLPNFQTSTARQMAEIMRSTGLAKYELDLLLLLLEEYSAIKDKTGLRNAYESLARVYEDLSDFETSVKYLKLYEGLREETQRLNQYTRLAKLDQELEVSETKRQKAELEIENKELEARRWRLRILAGSLVVIFLLSAVLFYLNRQRIINQRKRVEVENQLLERDLELKDAEMQRTTHELLRSNQSFSQLMGDMEKLTTNLSAENRKMARSLLIDHKAKAQEDIWRQFNLQFQNHYADFYENLSAKYPDLTQTEQRICAMHLSGLESKEISAITGQTLNSIYALKSKVRKKMAIESDANMTEILEEL